MNCVIGLVRKWLGDEMPRRLFALWADDTRRSAFDDLTWLALENAVYEKEASRPSRAHGAAPRPRRRIFCLGISALAAGVDGQEPARLFAPVRPLEICPWAEAARARPVGKGLSAALACPGALDADDLEAAVRAAFEKYLQFDGTPHKKSPFRLHFSDKWAPLLTKLLPVEIVRTDELTIGRSAVAGENGMVRASNALRAQLRSNEREAEDHDYIRALLRPQPLFPAGARAHRAALLHRRSPRLPSLVHPRRARAGPSPCAPTRSVFSSRPPSRQAQPRRLRPRQCAASECSPASDGADSQLYAHPSAARGHPRPRGAAGRYARLARTGAARQPRLSPQGRGEPRGLHRRPDARRLGLTPALSGEHRHSGLSSRQKPCLLRHSRARDQLLQPARLHGAARFEGFRGQKRQSIACSTTLPRAGTATVWLCAAWAS